MEYKNTEKKLAESLGIDIRLAQMRINGYSINYAVAGKGPPLLLIHGANFGWGVWYPNLPELAEHFTVYAIDLPGAGRSTRVDYTKLDPQKDLLEIVEQFVAELGINHADVIGCSIGGWLALQLAKRHPERVRRIIVENSVGFADYMSTSDKVIGFYPFAKLIAWLSIRPGTKGVEKFLRGIFYNHMVDLKSEFIEYFEETMETSHNLLFISRLTALHREFNMARELSGIPNKTLVIWGENDTIIPLHKNIKNFSLLPNSEVKIIKNAGHIPSLEQPHEFNKLAIDFLTVT